MKLDPLRRGTWRVWRLLLLAQVRGQPGRMVVTVFAIAMGVALGAAVYLVNTAALNEFGLATKRLVGEADIVVRAPRDGFAESLYPELAKDPAISVASPMLELAVALAGRRDTLKIIGVDPFLAASLQPALMGDIGSGIFDLFLPDGVYLSQTAAEQLQVRRGDSLPIIVGSSAKSLRVLGVLARDTYSQALGIMDIASAQWTFGRLGRLNRIDLRLAPGRDVETYRSELNERLPAGVLAVAPQTERDRAVTVTRAYRVNLNMLALVALWTGAFLVFSTQSLSVLRRRRSLALMRALGVTRGQLQWALIGEGAAFGAMGSIIGVAAGFLMAAAVLRLLAGDLGNGQLHSSSVSLHAEPWPMLAFFVIGTVVSALGAWLPSRGAAREHPARALKGGDGDYAVAARASWYAGITFLGIGALLAWLPRIGGLPVFGYLSVAALLCGAVLLVPVMTTHILQITPRTRHVVLRTALAQLKDNVGISTLSLASIIVSFSLMVAMAIMVYSFRESFDHWLGKLLPADLQIREPLGNDTAYWPAETQARLAAVKGISRIEFRRTRPLLLDASREPVTLIARNGSPAQVVDGLPLIRSLKMPLAPDVQPVWISEAMQDLYGYSLGSRISLPLQGRRQPFTVAGIWRDYARSAGAVVITHASYVRATGDDTASEGSIWIDGSRSVAAVESALRDCFARGDELEINTSSAIRERSLQIFDRAFAITYALEAIAVVIGLTGVSFAASSTALARRAEFGMLRHLGMLRRQIIAMLASEGVLMSLLGVGYGLALGAGLSLVLVYVINRQSFNWSIDLAVPYWQLAVLGIALIAAAAITAIWSGRAAMSQDAVRAVREDW
jgi:putative ABC transport system permease protein